MNGQTIFLFLHPWFLLLLPIPLLLLVLEIWRRKKRRPAVLYSDLSITRDLPHSIKQRVAMLMPWSRTVALCLGVIALARPQFGDIEYNVNTLGVDIALVIDVSNSMQQQDFAPNRLEAAKQAAIDFVKDRKTDRISVIAFGEWAGVLCPPTTDMATVERFIGAIYDGILPNSATAVGDGLGTALKKMEDSPAKSKVAILLTDGENNAGSLEPMQAAEIAKALGVRVYTIGVGGGSGARSLGGFMLPMPPGLGFDADTLRKIAELTGGRYFHATDERSLKEIYQEIDKMEKSEIEVDESADFDEKFMYLWYPALALLAFEGLLRAFWLRRLP